MPENLVPQLSHSGAGTLVRNAIRSHEILVHRIGGFCCASLTGRQFSSNSSGVVLFLASAPIRCFEVIMATSSRSFRLGSFHFTPEGCSGCNVCHLKDISNFLPVETIPAQVEHRSTLIVEMVGQSL